MKKWIGPLLSLFLALILGISLVSGPFTFFKKTRPQETRSEGYRMIPVQEEKEERKGDTDPHLILVLKELSKKLDEWLKKLNERIESEDVTRFEVRFLEILRNILEWIKEKVDAKIESSDKEQPKKNERGVFRETYLEVLPFSKTG
jgi:hypothetical protein